MTSSFGLLSYPDIANLGDTIQSLAARQFLPHVDRLIPRERINSDPGGDKPVNTILNGWFIHEPRNWPPHPRIRPLLISMHFSSGWKPRFRRWRPSYQDLFFTEESIAYLREHGPVGARDRFSLEQLQKRGIDGYLSGCLTLTLRPPVTSRLRRGIVACDLSTTQLKILTRLCPKSPTVVSHELPSHLTTEERFAAAEDMLSVYAGAQVVITTRIHAAMPCLAFGTPVLLIVPDRPDGRVVDVAAMTYSCRASQFREFLSSFDLSDPPPNPQIYTAFVGDLERRCREFVAERQAWVEVAKQ